MALTMRPTGLGSGIDKGRPNYTVFDRRVGGRLHLGNAQRARQSALVLVANGQRSDDALGSRGDLGAGQGEFQKSWDAWKAWATSEEVPPSSSRRLSWR